VEAEHWMPGGFGCEVRQRAVLAHVEVGADGARVLRQVAFEVGAASTGPSSVAVNVSVVRPRLSVTRPAARTLRAQPPGPKPATSQRPSRSWTGATGVVRGYRSCGRGR
jgi:hypothetical protein